MSTSLSWFAEQFETNLISTMARQGSKNVVELHRDFVCKFPGIYDFIHRLNKAVKLRHGTGAAVTFDWNCVCAPNCMEGTLSALRPGSRNLRIFVFYENGKVRLLQDKVLPLCSDADQLAAALNDALIPYFT